MTGSKRARVWDQRAVRRGGNDRPTRAVHSGDRDSGFVCCPGQFSMYYASGSFREYGRFRRREWSALAKQTDGLGRQQLRPGQLRDRGGSFVFKTECGLCIPSLTLKVHDHQ